MSITEHPKINEWLTLVEKEMRVTLAKLLAESVTEVEIFGKATSIDPSTYISWIDKYQVFARSVASQRTLSFGRKEIKKLAKAQQHDFYSSLSPSLPLSLCFSLGPACCPVRTDCLVRECGIGTERHGWRR